MYKKTWRNILALLCALVMLAAPGMTTLAAEPTLPISTEGVTLTICVPDNLYAPASYANNLEVFQILEEKTGVKLNWEVYPAQNYGELASIRLASGSDLPDLFYIPDEDINNVVKLAKDGVLAPLKQPIEQFAPNIMALYEKYPSMRMSTTLSDGEIYALAYSYYEQRELKVPTPAIRKDWLDELGLALPVTLDDWYNALVAMKEKYGTAYLACAWLSYPDGGGYGLFSMANGLRYGGASDGKMIDADGKVVYSQIQPEFKEYLAWMNKLYAAGVIYPDVTVDYTVLNQLFSDNQVAATITMSGGIPTYNGVMKEAGIENANLVPVMPPVMNAGEEQKLEIQNGTVAYFGVSSTCKDIEAAIKWLDYFYASDEGRTLSHWGIEGKTFVVENGVKQLTPYVMENPDGLPPLSVIRSIGGFNTFLMHRDKEFMQMVSSDVEIAYSKQIAGHLVEPFPMTVPEPDEVRKVSTIMADIKSYQDAMIAKFIMGLEPLDKFDEYVKMHEQLGINDALAIWQAQYDRVK